MNKIGDEGIEEIAKALAANRVLNMLYLGFGYGAIVWVGKNAAGAETLGHLKKVCASLITDFFN